MEIIFIYKNKIPHKTNMLYPITLSFVFHNHDFQSILQFEITI